MKRMYKMLTKREQEVMELTSRGLTSKKIAQELNVHECTIKQILVNIYSKFLLTEDVKIKGNGQRIKAIFRYLYEYKGIEELKDYVTID